jgi:hypothetical protein
MILALALAAAAAGPPIWDRPFDVSRPSEVTAVLDARCGGCSWGSARATAAILVLHVDGRYTGHLMLYRGQGPAEYRVSLGPQSAGRHRLAVTVARAPVPAAAHPVAVDDVRIVATSREAPDYLPLALAPVLHPRPNAVGRFTDVPLVMWYETEPTPRGTRIRYSVVFSNEDGGTPADRLMATWGRLTDIEYVLGVDVSAEGRVLGAEYQGPDHKILPVKVTEGSHPQLWVVTDNNMVQAHGVTRQVYAPAPIPFDLRGTSREAVMDANPWTYRVSAEEAMREGRVDESAKPGSRQLPDPRRFLYLEACAETVDAALTFGVGVENQGATDWYDSDGGQKEFRIIRRPDQFPNGCFRGAVALPAGLDDGRIRALRFRAFTRVLPEGQPPLAPGTGRARLLRVTRLFRLGPGFLPEPDLFSWTGDLPLVAEGAAVEVPVTTGSGASR